MDYNSPMDKFVMAIYVPQGIWALYVVLTSPLELAVSKNLADTVNSSERLEYTTILYTMSLCPQMTHCIGWTRLGALHLELPNKLIKFLVT